MEGAERMGWKGKEGRESKQHGNLTTTFPNNRNRSQRRSNSGSEIGRNVVVLPMTMFVYTRF